MNTTLFYIGGAFLFSMYFACMAALILNKFNSLEEK